MFRLQRITAGVTLTLVASMLALARSGWTDRTFDIVGSLVTVCPLDACIEPDNADDSDLEPASLGSMWPWVSSSVGWRSGQQPAESQMIAHGGLGKPKLGRL